MKRLRKVADIEKHTHAIKNPEDAPPAKRRPHLKKRNLDNVDDDVIVLSDDSFSDHSFTSDTIKGSTHSAGTSIKRRLQKVSDLKICSQSDDIIALSDDSFSDHSSASVALRPTKSSRLSHVKNMSQGSTDSAGTSIKRRLQKVSDLEICSQGDDIIALSDDSFSDHSVLEPEEERGNGIDKGGLEGDDFFASATRAYSWVDKWLIEACVKDDTLKLSLALLKSAGLLAEEGNCVKVLDIPIVACDSGSGKAEIAEKRQDRSPCGCDVLGLLVLHNSTACLKLFCNLKFGVDELMQHAREETDQHLLASGHLPFHFEEIPDIDMSSNRKSNKLLVQPKALGAKKCIQVYRSHTETFPSPLFIAIKMNHEQAVSIIAESFTYYSYVVLSSSLDDDDPQGPSLFFQLSRSHADDAITENLLSALHKCKEVHRHAQRGEGHISLAQSLVNQRNKEDRSSVIHWAAEEGNVSFVKQILEISPDMSMCRDASHVTPLHSACLMGHVGVVELLLTPKYGVDPDTEDATAWTPFMYAVHAEHEECALLVFKKSRVSDMDKICSLEVAISDPERMDAVLAALATIPDFFSLLNESLRQNLHFLRGKLQFLLEYPFLLDIDNRLAVAQLFVESSLDFEFAEAALSISNVEPPDVIFLSREHSWRSLLHTLNTDASASLYHDNHDDEEEGRVRGSSSCCLQRRVVFQFSGECGIGAGVEREVMEVLSADMIAPSSALQSRDTLTTCPLFSVVEDSTAQVCVPISRDMFPKNQEDPAYFEFGQLVGHLLLRRFRSIKQSSSSCVLSINVSECFWKVVCDETISLHDIASVDSDLYKNLQWMLSNEGASMLDLTFTATASDGTVVELKKNGTRINVSDSNKNEYVDLLVSHSVVSRMSVPAEQTYAGMRAVLPDTALSLFSGVDISILVTGVVEIDVLDWRKHASYSGYDEGCSVVSWFWEFVNGMNATSRSLLLRFCTGCTRLPPGGFCSVSPKFLISAVPYVQSCSLPTAATCFNLLRLPRYPDKASLRKNLHIAIVHGSEGFSFS